MQRVLLSKMGCTQLPFFPLPLNSEHESAVSQQRREGRLKVHWESSGFPRKARWPQLCALQQIPGVCVRALLDLRATAASALSCLLTVQLVERYRSGSLPFMQRFPILGPVKFSSGIALWKSRNVEIQVLHFPFIAIKTFSICLFPRCDLQLCPGSLFSSTCFKNQNWL